MYRVKPILGLLRLPLFLWPSPPSDAGNLAGKKLLVDTVFNMVDDNADKVNEGVNTLAPVAMAGDTVKVELFIDGGGWRAGHRRRGQIRRQQYGNDVSTRVGRSSM